MNPNLRENHTIPHSTPPVFSYPSPHGPAPPQLWLFPSCVTFLPKCSFPICFLVLSIQGWDHPTPFSLPVSQALLSLQKFLLSEQGRNASCLAASPFPKLTAQPLPPPSRPKFHALVIFNHTWVWRRGNLLHFPLRCYRRFQTPLSRPLPLLL